MHCHEAAVGMEGMRDSSHNAISLWTGTCLEPAAHLHQAQAAGAGRGGQARVGAQRGDLQPGQGARRAEAQLARGASADRRQDDRVGGGSLRVSPI